MAGQSSALNQPTTLSWREMIDLGFLVAGSVDSVCEQIEKLALGLKCGHLVCLLHFGDMPNELCRYSSELFARRVIPKTRPFWDEYTDHWSPQPMPRETRAVPRAPSRGAPNGSAKTTP